MPCYSPYKIKYRKFRVLSKDNINKDYNLSLSPRSSYDSGVVYDNNYYVSGNTAIDPQTNLTSTLVHQYVDCGKCYYCRSKKSNEWAMRISQEFFMNNSKGVFVTLTYNDKYLPSNNSVSKSEIQLFLKRLRHNIKVAGFNDKIKYFACGEYGTIRRRAHYHLIITGHSFSNKKMLTLVNKSWSKQVKLSNSMTSFECMGRTQVVSANASTIAYTTKYMIKDSDLYLNDDAYYAKYAKERPFRLVSKGIGKTFCFKYLDNIIENGFINHNGYKIAVPRTYLRWIRDALGSEKFNEIFQKRFLSYKKTSTIMLAERFDVKLDYSSFLFEEDVYNICNQSKLLPHYLNKLKEIQEIYTAKHKVYLEAKRQKSLKKLSLLDNVA